MRDLSEGVQREVLCSNASVEMLRPDIKDSTRQIFFYFNIRSFFSDREHIASALPLIQSFQMLSSPDETASAPSHKNTATHTPHPAAENRDNLFFLSSEDF